MNLTSAKVLVTKGEFFYQAFQSDLKLCTKSMTKMLSYINSLAIKVNKQVSKSQKSYLIKITNDIIIRGFLRKRHCLCFAEALTKYVRSAYVTLLYHSRPSLPGALAPSAKVYAQMDDSYK